jgi:hypothetical protein
MSNKILYNSDASSDSESSSDDDISSVETSINNEPIKQEKVGPVKAVKAPKMVREKVHNKTHTCDGCFMSFVNASSLARHLSQGRCPAKQQEIMMKERELKALEKRLEEKMLKAEQKANGMSTSSKEEKERKAEEKRVLKDKERIRKEDEKANDKAFKEEYRNRMRQMKIREFEDEAVLKKELAKQKRAEVAKQKRTVSSIMNKKKIAPESSGDESDDNSNVKQRNPPQQQVQAQQHHISFG